LLVASPGQTGDSPVAGEPLIPSNCRHLVSGGQLISSSWFCRFFFIGKFVVVAISFGTILGLLIAQAQLQSLPFLLVSNLFGT
jgi:hypothetical protein